MTVCEALRNVEFSRFDLGFAAARKLHPEVSVWKIQLPDLSLNLNQLQLIFDSIVVRCLHGLHAAVTVATARKGLDKQVVLMRVRLSLLLEILHDMEISGGGRFE